MALGDVDWPDAVPGSKHRADMFTLEGERSRRARLDSGLSVLTHQQRLGTADARSVEKQSHVASDAEPPRMGQAVSVDQDQARLSTQSSEGCQQQRALAERKAARARTESAARASPPDAPPLEARGNDKRSRRRKRGRRGIKSKIGFGQEADSTQTIKEHDGLSQSFL